MDMIYGRNYNKVEADLESIEKINDRIYSDFSIIVNHSPERDNDNNHGLYNYFNNKYYWDGITGIIKDKENGITLNLRNEFDRENKNYFLMHMIQKAWTDVKSSPFESNITEEDIFRFLYIFIFKEALKEAYKSGPYKCYRTFYNNDDRVHGVIDISRHIKTNLGLNNGKITYSYRENTVDNEINHLIIFTYELLKRDFPDIFSSISDSDSDFDAIIRSLKMQCPSWNLSSERSVLSKAVKPIPHPLFQSYEKLRKICIRILNFEGLSFDNNDDDETVNSILFYLPDLWEKYLEKLISDAFSKKGEYSLNTQVSIGVLKNSDTPKGLIEKRPDYLVKDKNGDNIAVLDAKFKSHYSNLIKINKIINESQTNDILQCIGYKAIFNTKTAGILFPAPSNSENVYKEYEISSECKDEFFILGLHVPDVNKYVNFADWQNDMAKNEKQFINYLLYGGPTNADS